MIPLNALHVMMQNSEKTMDLSPHRSLIACKHRNEFIKWIHHQTTKRDTHAWNPGEHQNQNRRDLWMFITPKRVGFDSPPSPAVSDPGSHGGVGISSHNVNKISCLAI